MSYVKPSIPLNEAERLLALKGFHVLDTPPDADLDDITLLASQICGVPIALISLIDENRQWFKSKVGLAANETPRDISFCGHAINAKDVFVVEDAVKDPRFQENPLVTGDLSIRFYAGAQLATADGYNIGTLCVIDKIPHKLGPAQKGALEALARQVVINFENARFKAETQRRENFLSSIVGMLPNLVSYVDQGYRYRYVNPAYESWFNLKSQDILGLTISEVVGQSAFEKARPFMDFALSGEQQNFQMSLPYKVSGKTLPRDVKIQYLPDLGANGEVLGFYSIVSDISDLKALERQAIEKSEELEKVLGISKANEKAFRAIFDDSPIGIIRLNSKLRYSLVNPAYAKFLGYSVDELLGMTMLDVTHPDDLPKTIDRVSNLSHHGVVVNRFEKRYIHKNGSVVWGKVTSRVVKDEDNKDYYLSSVVEDITDLKVKESELVEAQARLVAAAKMASLGQMAAGVAHEINNPLAILRGKAELMLRRLSKGNLEPENLTADLQIMIKTTERISKIVLGLRSFSRGSVADDLEVVPFQRILEETLSLCAEKIKFQGIELKIDVPEGVLIRCRGSELSQILLNLLSNAQFASAQSPQKWIQLKGSLRGANLEIKVIDSGLGLSKEVQSRLMEPFFTTKAVGEGTGLGLSISKGLAESNGGRLYYDPNSPHTCFVLECLLAATETLKAV